MNDEWRLQIDLHEPGHGEALTDRLEAREIEHDLSLDFEDRVIVSRDGPRVFLYAGSREQIEKAHQVVVGLAGEHGWRLETEIRRWHPDAEDWEAADKSLPRSTAEHAAEQAELMRQEDRETEERGYPEFEVRVDLGSRHEAVELARQLREEGVPNVHRWRFVLVGAVDEDAAKALAERIRSEAPADGKVKVEGVWPLARREGPSNPFAFLGGLADT